MIPLRPVVTLIAATLAAAPALAQTGPVVETPAGRLSGTAQGDVEVFKGVPYAVPPVGKLRWTAPEPLPRWQ